MTTAVSAPTERAEQVGEGRVGTVPRAAGAAVLSPWLDRLLARMGPFDADACMSCGICTATCPLGIDVLPRRVLRYAALGLGDQVRAAGDTIFSCLLCRACEVSCPAGVHITEDIRLLRRWLLQEGW